MFQLSAKENTEPHQEITSQWLPTESLTFASAWTQQGQWVLSLPKPSQLLTIWSRSWRIRSRLKASPSGSELWLTTITWIPPSSGSKTSLMRKMQWPSLTNYMRWEVEINLKQCMTPFSPPAKDSAGLSHRLPPWSDTFSTFLTLLLTESSSIPMRRKKDANAEFRPMKWSTIWTWGKSTTGWSRWGTIQEWTRWRRSSRGNWEISIVPILDMLVRWTLGFQTWLFTRSCQICDR